MDRRKVLVGGTSILLPTVSGCLGVLPGNSSNESENEKEAPQLPDGMTIETTEIEGPMIKGGRVPDEVVVPNAATANETLHVDYYEQVQTFVNETNFTKSYIVAIDGGKSPDKRFKVDSIQRTQTGLTIEYSAVRESDKPARGSYEESGFLIRVKDENGAIPDSVTANH